RAEAINKRTQQEAETSLGCGRGDERKNHWSFP
ncbi:hypothetical protein CRG98_049197, partial [Punica granatum]